MLKVIGPTYTVVRQPNSWSCMAAVAAIACRTSIEHFIEFVGHDGSEHDEASTHPRKVRGFKMAELAAYLASHNMHFGCNLDADFKVEPDYSSNRPAFLTVKPDRMPEPNTHIVFTLSGSVFDPEHDYLRRLSQYEIIEWWPIITWS